MAFGTEDNSFDRLCNFVYGRTNSCMDCLADDDVPAEVRAVVSEPDGAADYLLCWDCWFLWVGEDAPEMTLYLL